MLGKAQAQALEQADWRFTLASSARKISALAKFGVSIVCEGGAELMARWGVKQSD